MELQNKKMKSSVFVAEVNHIFDKLKKENPDYKNIRLRKGPIKQVIEELQVLKDFIIEIEKEKGPIFITYHGTDSDDDATIEIEKDNKQLYVQVTIATDEEAYLRRQATVEGVPVFFGKTERNRKTGRISSRPNVFKNDELIKKNAQIIQSAIDKKKSFSYGSDRILLIGVEEYSLILDDEWDKIKLMINKDRVSFDSVWLRRNNGQCEKIL